MVYSNMFEAVRKQLSMSQEQLEREATISFLIVNIWENYKSKTSLMTKKLWLFVKRIILSFTKMIMLREGG